VGDEPSGGAAPPDTDRPDTDRPDDRLPSVREREKAEKERAKAARERELNEARIESLSWISRQQLRTLNSEAAKKANEEQRRQIEDQMAKLNPAFVRNDRLQADFALNMAVPTFEGALEVAAMIALLAWPSVWVIWAFLWRGGLSYRIVQIALVRGDGRPAGRWQCAWRAFLVWVPLTALLLVSLWLNAWYWSVWHPGTPYRWVATLSSLTWYAAAILLLVYAVLAVWLPTRSLHDRLAGTYLVPR